VPCSRLAANPRRQTQHDGQLHLWRRRLGAVGEGSPMHVPGGGLTAGHGRPVHQGTDGDGDVTQAPLAATHPAACHVNTTTSTTPCAGGARASATAVRWMAHTRSLPHTGHAVQPLTATSPHAASSAKRPPGGNRFLCVGGFAGGGGVSGRRGEARVATGDSLRHLQGRGKRDDATIPRAFDRCCFHGPGIAIGAPDGQLQDDLVPGCENGDANGTTSWSRRRTVRIRPSHTHLSRRPRAAARKHSQPADRGLRAFFRHTGSSFPLAAIPFTRSARLRIRLTTVGQTRPAVGRRLRLRA